MPRFFHGCEECAGADDENLPHPSMRQASPAPALQGVDACVTMVATMPGDLGRMLMIVGGVLVILGALFSFGGRLPWLGRLPGDIVIERENFRFYFPLATSIVVSIILSLLFGLFRR